MGQLTLATQFVQQVYELQPTQIEIVPPFFNWRGLYRVHDTLGRIWILRLLQLPTARDALSKTAYLLHWLKQQQYPAPRLALTRDHHQVGFLDGWCSLLLSYIDGAVLDVQSPDFIQLGYTLGQLHTLPCTSDTRFPRSRCDPVALQTQTAQQLVYAHDHVPPSFQALITTLQDSLIPLAAPNHTLCLTHGDCWYKNAVKTAEGSVVLIDWDCGGIGLPILDLGFLLLTAHYDFTQPFHIAVDADKIQAIMQGYQRARQITTVEYAHMQSAIQGEFHFSSSGQWLLQQLTVTGGQLPSTTALGDTFNGGGIRNFSNLTISDSVIRNNTAARGGGIAQNTKKVVIERSLISDNRAIAGDTGSFADGGGGILQTRSWLAHGSVRSPSTVDQPALTRC